MPNRVPNERATQAFRKKEIPLECGIADGETRTRTGDTTIFRQMLRTLEQPWKYLQIGVVLKRVTSVEVSRN